MTFTSFTFYLFLPFVFLLFCWTADRWRWLVLLAASYAFYASFNAPYLLAVLLMVTVISYGCGLKINEHQDDSTRKRWFLIGSVSCVVILAVMKYIPLLETQSANLFGLNLTATKTLISIGVSYFAFQAISYLADIYLETVEPERHFGHFALYMAFFPKLLQGPIERPGDLLPQIREPYCFDYDAVRSGLLLIAWGLFKKIVVADRLAPYVDQAYNTPLEAGAVTVVIGTYAYALQIYFDFAGYTDMARGTARLFGLNLSENFNRPYLATSIADFWRRWHMTFSRWILDYIFKPLNLLWRDLGKTGTAGALIVTFLISGIWHGVAWGFVVWGLLHGVYLASSTFYQPYRKKLYCSLGIEKKPWLAWWQVFATFNLVSFAWLFFRAKSLADAGQLIRNTLVLKGGLAPLQGVIKQGDTWTLIASLLLVAVFTSWDSNTLAGEQLKTKPVLLRWAAYHLVIISILACSVTTTSRFIYFAF